MSTPFNETEWREQCESLAKKASDRCSLSHDYYVTLFSNSINAAVGCFSENDQIAALEIAREWDYATKKEIAETDQWNYENGSCSHGIELGCCPAGCGSF